MLRVLPVVLALALALAVAPAADAATKRERARAKRLTKAGSRHFAAQRYKRALRSFERAYRLVPLPALRYNIGQCHLLLGDHEAAIAEFEKFLEEKPDTPYAADVEKLIRDARRELAARAPPEPEPEPDPEPPVAVAVAPPPPPPPPPPSIVTTPAEPRITTEPDDESLLSQWWLWAIVGGVAIAAGGTAIALTTGGETRTVLPMGDLGVIDRRGLSR